jgi:multicomponent Na+:H+ antiporter subunit C
MIETGGLIITAVILLLAGAVGFALQRDFLRRVLAFNVMSTGAFLLLAGMAPTEDMQAPVIPGLLILLLLVTTALSGIALKMRTSLVRSNGETDPDGGDAP